MNSSPLAKNLSLLTPSNEALSTPKQSPVLSVKLFKNQQSKEIFIWDTRSLLLIGSPLKWSLEIIHENTILIRNLTSPLDALHSNQHIKITLQEAIGAHQPISLPGSEHHTLTFQNKKNLTPAYLSQPSKNSKVIGFEIFSVFGNIIQKSDAFYQTYSVFHKGKKTLFIQKNSENSLELTNLSEDLNYTLNGKSQALTTNQKITLTQSELEEFSLHSHQWTWRISPLYSEHAHIDFTSLQISNNELQVKETQFLKKSSAIVGALFAVFMLLVFLMPTSKEEEKIEEIPPQFAKIILKPKVVQSESTSQVEEKARPSQNQKQAQAAANQQAIKKAFRTQAVQNSLSKLVKGGMNRVLANSKILTTAPSNLAVGSLYSAPSNTVGNSLKDQLDTSKILSVAAIGGEKGAAGGSGAGYGTGTSAQVSGQGSGFVDLDFGNASISKGLTADEVGKVIHKHLKEVQYCYESSMMRNPSVQGKLTLDFIIGITGKVTNVTVKNSNLNDARLEDCILKRLVTWPFPRPKGNVEVAISYPFILKALGR